VNRSRVSPPRLVADRYGAVAIALHWTIALAIIGLLALGMVMVRMTPASSLQFELYQLHKSLGITVLVLSILRLGWRLTHPAPPLPTTLKTWEARLARFTHLSFYVLMLVLPLTGWMMVSASVWNLPTIIFGLFRLPHLPVLSTLPDKKPIEEALKDIHEWLAVAAFALLLLHVAGALKHHFIARDDTLIRMLPWGRAGIAGPEQHERPS
jgi:cytochrome b561